MTDSIHPSSVQRQAAVLGRRTRDLGAPPARHLRSALLAGLIAVWALPAAWAQPAAGTVTTAPAPGAGAAPDTPAATAPAEPFHLRTVTLTNGLVGRALTVPSANPRNYEDIIARRPAPEVTLHAKLFVPRGNARAPAVIIAPGSGGVNAWMLVHAAAFTDAGIAVLLLDPFGGRGVTNTIAAQDPFSFAASTWDIFAAVRVLRQQPDIDGDKLGAIGYSRGGNAVLQSAIRELADAALGADRGLTAVLSAWPWCGSQFANPTTAPTAVRFALADSDDWVSPLQCQAYFNAMRPRNPAVSLRLFAQAHHGFGYGAPLREIPQAIKALNAPVVHFDARGVAIDPWNGNALPGADDAQLTELMRRFLSRGVRAGTQGDQMAEFTKDAVGFFVARLKP